MNGTSSQRTGDHIRPDAVAGLSIVESFDVFYRRELPRLVADAPSLMVACGLAMRRFDPS